jgi:hypothetical protein
MSARGLAEFTKKLLNGGGLSGRGFLLLPAYYVQLLASIPFSLIQHFIFNHRISKTAIDKDPVFILGHYRSGTTYLQKLLATNRDFGFLTNYDALFANTCLLFGLHMQKLFQGIINMFHIRNPFFNTSTAFLSDPTEEDDFLMNKASAFTAYWGFVFPKKSPEWLNQKEQFTHGRFLSEWKKEYVNTLKYATFKNSGRRLVLKNPPSTGRIQLLLEIFPSAKFVFIYRNPYEVYYSTLNMWKKAILPYYSLQHIDGHDLDAIIFGHYNYLMEQYEAQKYLIPQGNLIEISYEELMSDPYSGIQKIYSGLNLEGFEHWKQCLEQTIAHEMNYRNNFYSYSGETLQKISDNWGRFIKLWNYREPIPRQPTE